MVVASAANINPHAELTMVSMQSWRWLACSRHGHWTGVDQLLCDRIDPDVEALQRARAQQYEISRLAEHEIVRRVRVRGVDDPRARPAQEYAAISLAEAQLLAAHDADSVENVRWEARKLGAGVHEDVAQGASRAGTRRTADLDIDTKASHVVDHMRLPAQRGITFPRIGSIQDIVRYARLVRRVYSASIFLEHDTGLNREAASRGTKCREHAHSEHEQ